MISMISMISVMYVIHKRQSYCRCMPLIISVLLAGATATQGCALRYFVAAYLIPN